MCGCVSFCHNDLIEFSRDDLLGGVGSVRKRVFYESLVRVKETGKYIEPCELLIGAVCVLVRMLGTSRPD